MPLDTTGILSRISDIDQLEALGITPIPAARIEAHKAHMLRWYDDRPDAKWRELCLPNHGLMQSLDRSSVGVPRAPKKIREIAQYVQQSVPGAEFHLGYFYTDPYLKVTYGEPSNRKTAYLGLWTNRWWAKAVATRT